MNENKRNPPLSRKSLNCDRLKFGLSSLLYNGDEIAFSPVHTAVIRALGGNDIHLGVMGALQQSLGQLFSWMGAVLLRWFKFNRKAMQTALIIAAVIQGIIVSTMLFSVWHPAWASACLVAYMALVAMMCMLTGVQQNIAVSWIGDLVPDNQRGWFVSGMVIVSNIGLVILQLTFARLSRNAGMLGYAGLMALLMCNTVIATGLVSRITNRPSQAVSFISKKKENRVNYRYRPIWMLIWFECAWRSGRVALVAFSTAYLIDYFGYKMDKIILINMIVYLVTIMMLYITGKLSDKIGIFRPLALISTVCGASMLLWVSSAWWGIVPIIVYQVLNGAAGSTHWMLLSNLGLQVYPAKGRSNFISFSRGAVGIFLMGISTVAGYVMRGIRGWSVELWGHEFNHYHLFFLGCTILTLGCLIPLSLLKHSLATSPTE